MQFGIYILLFINLLLSEPFENYKIGKTYNPLKYDKLSISIDGLLSEYEWSQSIILNDFIQAEPFFGSQPTKNTDVRIIYDDYFLYIGVFLEDDKSNIVGKKTNHDDWYEGFEKKSDYFVVEIDSEHNHSSSYCFAVNSAGVEADYQILNDQGDINDDWNADWTSFVSINEQGWFIEYRIPWKILRYYKGDIIGINFSRFIYSSNETLYWSLLPIELNGIISHYGHLEGLEIPQQKNLSIQPYITYGNTEYNNLYYEYNSFGALDFDAGLFEYGYNNLKSTFGFDIAYHPNNYLSLEYTLNPDFGQVEQDPSQINFSGFEIYYDEKRTFFNNNQLLFDTPIEIFYSKRIGDNIYLNNYNYETNIDYALKFSGASPKGFLYGFLMAQSSIDINDNIVDDKQIDAIVSRLRKNIFNESSYIGFMNTFYKDFHDESNVLSFDGMLGLLDNKFKIDGQVVLSEIQTSNLEKGYSYEMSYTDKISRGFLDNNIVDIWVNHEKYSRLLDINYLGYLRRNDFKSYHYGIAFSKQINGKHIKNYSFNIQNITSKNIKGILIDKDFSFNLLTSYINNTSFDFSYIKSFAHYNDWLKLSDYDKSERDLIVVKKPESNNFSLTFSSDPLKKWSFIYSLEYFTNKINDYGGGYSLNLIYSPLDWLFIDINYDLDLYREKYHFLKIEPYTNIPDPSNNNLIRFNPIEDYYFSNSKIFEREIAILISSYISDRFSVKSYSRYFTFINSYPDYYYYLDENHNYDYPNQIQEISLEQKETDAILYNSKFVSLELNFIFQWELNQRINFYIIYSGFKGIYGKRFNSLNEFIKYDINVNSNVRAEHYYDQSFYIKLDCIFIK
ncbi:MAG: hypothetical protein CMG66_05620 [Candidatus Marinimicrobia bacterium]|nr:hypothetical protein [Candidatus Neomarinimicrobiota bacterium]|tara:strand:- start:12116 stop:14647 length:2532 start_codon:yes stop_codon:yes gene_type:complete